MPTKEYSCQPINKLLSQSMSMTALSKPNIKKRSTGSSPNSRKILAKFDMENCHPVKAPCNGNASVLHARTEDEAPASDPELYRSITSSIMHLAVWTRPDISYIVNKLCQFNHNPSEIHAKSVKHLLRYIARTLNYSITYSHSEGNTFDVGYNLLKNLLLLERDLRTTYTT